MLTAWYERLRKCFIILVSHQEEVATRQRSSGIKLCVIELDQAAKVLIVVAKAKA